MVVVLVTAEAPALVEGAEETGSAAEASTGAVLRYAMKRSESSVSQGRNWLLARFSLNCLSYVSQ